MQGVCGGSYTERKHKIEAVERQREMELEEVADMHDMHGGVCDMHKRWLICMIGVHDAVGGCGWGSTWV